MSAALLQKPPIEDKEAAHDFALGYDWADVHDETDEGMHIVFTGKIWNTISCLI